VAGQAGHILDTPPLLKDKPCIYLLETTLSILKSRQQVNFYIQIALVFDSGATEQRVGLSDIEFKDAIFYTQKTITKFLKPLFYFRKSRKK